MVICNYIKIITQLRSWLVGTHKCFDSSWRLHMELNSFPPTLGSCWSDLTLGLADILAFNWRRSYWRPDDVVIWQQWVLLELLLLVSSSDLSRSSIESSLMFVDLSSFRSEIGHDLSEKGEVWTWRTLKVLDWILEGVIFDIINHVGCCLGRYPECLMRIRHD